MADEPDNFVLRLLREIRDVQGSDLKYLRGRADYLTGRIDDLYKISTHTLGVAATAHERYESLEATVKSLTERVERLETKVG